MSYQQYRPNSFSLLTPVVKNLLIINGLLFAGSLVFESQFGVELNEILGLHFPLSDAFRPYQLITYMFMHATFDAHGQIIFSHVFFNMFALWMFGNPLENLWGGKRFLLYYILTGVGAGVVQLLVAYLRLLPLYSQVSQDTLELVMTQGQEIIQNGQYIIEPAANAMNGIINSTTVGASGAVFGILLAFGMLFPNTVLYLYFAIPIKAKWFVILYGAAELFLGIANNASDNVAHFAHLGGMLFGFILIKYWQKKSNHFY